MLPLGPATPGGPCGPAGPAGPCGPVWFQVIGVMLAGRSSRRSARRRHGSSRPRWPGRSIRGSLPRHRRSGRDRRARRRSPSHQRNADAVGLVLGLDLGLADILTQHSGASSRPQAPPPPPCSNSRASSDPIGALCTFLLSAQQTRARATSPASSAGTQTQAQPASPATANVSSARTTTAGAGNRSELPVRRPASPRLRRLRAYEPGHAAAAAARV